MIHPIPPGVHPNTHRCGCGGGLLMPWVATLKDHALRCMADPTHDTYQKKNTGTRLLFDPDRGDVEVSIMTGKETGTLTTMDETTALAKVQQANQLGLFPTNETSLPHLLLLAQVAFAYGLDPLMQEIIPYQGRPYITIAGRRRLDATAGHHPSIAFRLLSQEETDYYTAHGALDQEDIAGFCVLTTEHGARVEGFGRVLAKQRSVNQRGADHLPTVQYSIEMAQKRQERRAREMAYGPVPRPASLSTLTILEEGDEDNVVEGEGRLISSDSTQTKAAAYTATDTDYGLCPEHQVPWSEGQYGPYHRIDSGWCRFGKVYGAVFKEAVLLRHGKYDTAEWNAWLKEVYGTTWSKLTPDQMMGAIRTIQGPQSSDTPKATEGPTAEEAEGMDGLPS